MFVRRDIKSENVLRTPKGTWVLADFGSATTRAKVYQTTEEIGTEEYNIQRSTTPAYRAPEMWDLYRRQYIGPPADVWALGCLLYLLMYGRLPFDGLSGLQVGASWLVPRTLLAGKGSGLGCGSRPKQEVGWAPFEV